MHGRISEFEFEQRVREIESATIINVWYEEEEEEEMIAGDDAAYHSVPRAVYLQTAGKQYFRVTWGDELNIHHGFGISFKQVTLYPERNKQLRQLTQSAPWQNFMGRPVNTTRIHWESVLNHMRSRLLPVCGMGYLRRLDYPQSIELSFDAETSLFFSCISVDRNGNIATMTNHLTIFFSSSIHNHYNKPSREW